MVAVTNVWLMAAGDVHKLVLVTLLWLVQRWVSGTPGRVWAQQPWWPLGPDPQCPPFSLLRGSALVRRTLPARMLPWPSSKCSKRISWQGCGYSVTFRTAFHSVIVGMVDLRRVVNDVFVLSVKMLCRWPRSIRFSPFPMAVSFILFSFFFLTASMSLSQNDS